MTEEARITSIKREIIRTIKPLLTDGYSYHDSAGLLSEKDCPAVSISSDHDSEVEENSHGILSIAQPISLDIYTILGSKNIKGINDTDILTQKVVKALLAERSLNRNVLDIKVKKTSAMSNFGKEEIRILMFDLLVAYYMEVSLA